MKSTLYGKVPDDQSVWNDLYGDIPIDSGLAAKVEIELTLKGKAQSRSYEVWGVIDGRWFYRETTK